MLNDVTLDRIADRIGEQQVSLGLRLGFTHDQIRRARQEWTSHKDATLHFLVVCLCICPTLVYMEILSRYSQRFNIAVYLHACIEIYSLSTSFLHTYKKNSN